MTITNTFSTANPDDRLRRLAAIHRRCILKLQTSESAASAQKSKGVS